MKRVITFVLFVLLAAGQAQAADLQVFTSCIQPMDDALIVQFGYEASAAGESPMIGSVGDVYVDIDGVEAGQHEQVAEVTLNQGQRALFFIGAWFSGEYVYSEVWADGETSAPPCDAQTVEGGGFIALDDQGQPNNPAVNERANACYAPGMQCQTEAEWKAGWYLIRQQ